MMIEVRGDRRLRRARASSTPNRVSSSSRPRYVSMPSWRARDHAGRDVAGALAVAHELALEVARGGAPAVGAQPGGDRDELARRDRGGAPRARCRRARRGSRRRTSPASVQPMPSSHAAIRSASPSADSGGQRPVVEPAPRRAVAGPARREHGRRASDRSARARQRRPPRLARARGSPNGNGDA